MILELRPGRPEDAVICGQICYDAFKIVADQHGFLPSYASLEVAIASMDTRFAHSSFYSVVAEDHGRVVGSNFLDERSSIVGLGPITVDPTAQNRSVGRQLMQHVLSRAEQCGVPGVRLVYAAFHLRALSLYTKMGFDVRESLVKMEGAPIAQSLPGYDVRPASPDDLDACNRICTQVHGCHRGGELQDAIAHGTATVVEHGGRLCGYATMVGVAGHAVGEHNDALKALISAAPDFVRGGFIVPVRNSELLRWCLAQRLRVAAPQTLMSIGFYQEPEGAFLPSILY